MSQKIRAKARRELTVEDFASFLNAKKVSAKCPSCNNEATSINIDDDGNVVRLRYQIAQVDDDGDVGIFKGGILVAAATTCRNCGYMRMFSSIAIEKWLDEQQITESPQSE